MNKILFDIAAFRVSIYEELCPQDNGTLVTKMMMDIGLKIHSFESFLVLHNLEGFFVHCLQNVECGNKFCDGNNRSRKLRGSVRNCNGCC